MRIKCLSATKTAEKKQTTNINDQRRFIANLERDEEHLHGIAKDRDRFFLLVEKCNQYYRSGHDLSKYREIIQMHRDSDALAPLLHDPSFFGLIWNTLDTWNMNQRGARLVSLDVLKKSITKWRFNL